LRRAGSACLVADQLPSRPSLENLSGDPAQEHFSDGVTETIITDLGKLEGIRVISRTSSCPGTLAPSRIHPSDDGTG
jgi:TolB-like protein